MFILLHLGNIAVLIIVYGMSMEQNNVLNPIFMFDNFSLKTLPKIIESKDFQHIFVKCLPFVNQMTDLKDIDKWRHRKDKGNFSLFSQSVKQTDGEFLAIGRTWKWQQRGELPLN